MVLKMYLEEEKETVETEEVKDAEVVEEKKENNGGKKEYHINKENFKKALTLAIIGLALQTIIWIIEAIINNTVDHTGLRITLNLVFDGVGLAGMLIIGIMSLKFFLGTVNQEKDHDIATWIIVLVTFIIAFLCALAFAINVLRETIDLIHWFINK